MQKDETQTIQPYQAIINELRKQGRTDVALMTWLFDQSRKPKRHLSQDPMEGKPCIADPPNESYYWPPSFNSDT